MFLTMLAAASVAAHAQPARNMPVINPAPESSVCPETPMSVARKQGERLRGVPLNKLPPAQTFMAVDRRINGCPSPLTMIDYKNPRRR